MNGFTSFEQISRIRRNREIVLFGSGAIAEKTLRRLDVSPSFIVDNSENLWGSTYYGLSVCPPEQLKELGGSGRYLVIICSTSFEDISSQLVRHGFASGEDSVVSPILNDLRIVSDLEAVSADLLVTSGAPHLDRVDAGGGLYRLSVHGHEWNHTKLFAGPTHGIAATGDSWVVVHQERGIMRIDADGRELSRGPLPSGSRPHGIAWCSETECFYVACSYLDAVLVLGDDFNQIGRLEISSRRASSGTAQHHINDVCVVGSSLFVSMFSSTGNWKRGVFDGCVKQYDARTCEYEGDVLTDLWMPHNVCSINGELAVCDSLRGELKTHNSQPIGRFPGFTRGLAHNGSLFFVGQSRNRNFSKHLGLSLNISIDTGVIIFDEATKVSRTIHLPSSLSEIHAISVIDWQN